MTDQQPLTSITDPDELWQKFFAATEDNEPRETLLEALQYVTSPATVLDLGCGCGNDTLALLKHGFTVTAVDAQDEAVRRTLEKARKNHVDGQLTAIESTFENYQPEVNSFDFIYAGFSLPFCSKDYFPVFWDSLLHSLKPGGIIAGQLFGDHDEWVSKPDHPANIFLSIEEFSRITKSLERLYFKEDERDGTTALDCAKHWHVYHFILRCSIDEPTP